MLGIGAHEHQLTSTPNVWPFPFLAVGDLEILLVLQLLAEFVPEFLPVSSSCSSVLN